MPEATTLSTVLSSSWRTAYDPRQQLQYIVVGNGLDPEFNSILQWWRSRTSWQIPQCVFGPTLMPTHTKINESLTIQNHKSIWLKSARLCHDLSGFLPVVVVSLEMHVLHFSQADFKIKRLKVTSLRGPRQQVQRMPFHRRT